MKKVGLYVGHEMLLGAYQNRVQVLGERNLSLLRERHALEYANSRLQDRVQVLETERRLGRYRLGITLFAASVVGLLAIVL